MFGSVRSYYELLRLVMQRIAFALVIALGVGMALWCGLCALGLAPWPEVTIGFDGVPQEAGPALLVGISALALALCFYLPAQARIMALETSHRSFHMGMRDVARAYAAAHQADREDTFRLKGEFDSIRERIGFLRDHPDLSELEPSVLELAAQMSHVSTELAQTYSDANVARARDFLTARQQEIESFNERIARAKEVANEMRHWITQVELEEAMARSQLARLRDQLDGLLERLPDDLPPPAQPAAEAPSDTTATVTRLEPRAAE